MSRKTSKYRLTVEKNLSILALHSVGTFKKKRHGMFIEAKTYGWWEMTSGRDRSAKKKEKKKNWNVHSLETEDVGRVLNDLWNLIRGPRREIAGIGCASSCKALRNEKRQAENTIITVGNNFKIQFRVSRESCEAN